MCQGSSPKNPAQRNLVARVVVSGVCFEGLGLAAQAVMISEIRHLTILRMTMAILLSS